METLFTVIVMLALATPAPAEAAKADPKDISLIFDWQDATSVCFRGILPEDDARTDDAHPARDKVCAQEARLQKRLITRGYCVYGHGEVGRASRDRKHCYEIDNLPAR